MDAVTEPVTRPARSRIDRLEDPDTFSYHEFFHKYMIANAPCLFSAEFTRSWSSRRSWVTADNNPNWDHLLQVFGDAIVPVANCDVKEYNANPKELLPLREYIAYWRDYIKNGHRSAGGCLYLKDWHMRREFPDQDVYDTPVYFSSDWLNEYWDAVGVDDYRFVYMGPAGSWTPFHADVFRSYSWSANICGRKKWLLLPPGQEEDLRDCSGHLPYDVTALSLQNRCPPPLEVIQEAGEIIFVPSGWHHQVYNLEDTISINHNWVNGCNVSVMWSFLQTELSAAQREISEWKETMDDWEHHCQLILKSCTGIHYKEFYTFLRIIAEHRIQALQDGHETLQGPNVMAPGPRHVQFDLRRIVETLMLLMDNKDFQKLDTETLRPRPEDLLRELEHAIGGIVTG
ncbi:2-oxoglutarate and iron-dependent oxygenase JMJD4 isoform X1 [Bufo gargarizans]|uniref:2-oxoglutarate and iron-dependent oxygenase JMJD4 isoform X1 n=1 Tax=Bufo gargarizans TaxID=30331 RepID=UPI001CF174C5|nr:2-oxoglutarate and iron-dependent oxygenase JMJD4 isoform X1 [Bufo gargarizans]XP_044150049.1 2-oxoglutarate and iron-dependent oxygenase JMJD4 isoform X1 [Bufo gargarizans]